MCYVPVQSLLYCRVLNGVISGALLFAYSRLSWTSFVHPSRNPSLRGLVDTPASNEPTETLTWPTILAPTISSFFSTDLSDFDLQTADSHVHPRKYLRSNRTSNKEETARFLWSKAADLMDDDEPSIASEEAADIGSTILNFFVFIFNTVVGFFSSVFG